MATAAIQATQDRTFFGGNLHMQYVGYIKPCDSITIDATNAVGAPGSRTGVHTAELLKKKVCVKRAKAGVCVCHAATCRVLTVGLRLAVSCAPVVTLSALRL
eukprot:16809-Heterococcus_DN1.PRE.2